jgi:hypothetical protein
MSKGACGGDGGISCQEEKNVARQSPENRTRRGCETKKGRKVSAGLIPLRRSIFARVENVIE